MRYGLLICGQEEVVSGYLAMDWVSLALIDLTCRVQQGLRRFFLQRPNASRILLC